MKEGWIEVVFSELFNDPKKAIISGPFGSNLKSAEYQSEGVPLVRLQNVDRWNFIDKNIIYITPEKAEELSSHSYKAGDILITKLGAPLGKACIAPESSGEGIVLADIVRVRVDKNSHDKSFIVYQLNSQEISNQLKEQTTGATRPRVTLKNFRALKFVTTILTEQKKIVAILDKAFAAIDQAKANIEKNIENAQQLFQSKLNQIFSQKGDGWEEKTLGNVFKLKSGAGLTAKNMVDGTFPVYGGNGIAGYHNKFNFNTPQVIVGRVGALCGNVRLIDEDFWLTDNAFRISEGLERFDNDFVTLLLNHKNLRSYARQSAQPVVSNSSLKNVSLSYPTSDKEQVQIRKKLRAIESDMIALKNLYQNKLCSLKELKKSILQKAFAGELTH